MTVDILGSNRSRLTIRNFEPSYDKGVYRYNIYKIAFFSHSFLYSQ